MTASPLPQQQAAQQMAAPQMRINTFQQLVALATEKRDPLLVSDLERHVRLVRLEDGLFEFALAAGADTGIVQRVTRRLQEWTGRRWTVALSNEPGEPTFRELADARRAEEESLRHSHPVVQAVLKMFPGATVVPAVAKMDAPLTLSAAELAAQPVVNEDGDVVAGDGELTEDDL
jgi:DNA polymerase III subunit gamma/tau